MQQLLQVYIVASAFQKQGGGHPGTASTALAGLTNCSAAHAEDASEAHLSAA